MKTKCFLIVLFTFAISLTAQETKVPSKVKDAFSKLYPKAADVKWIVEKKSGFEAEFKDKGNSVALTFDNEGKLLETETTIPKTDLPKEIPEYITKNYKGYSVTEAAKIVDSKSVVTFEAEVTKGKVKKDVIFTQDGKPIKSKSQK